MMRCDLNMLHTNETQSQPNICICVFFSYYFYKNIFPASFQFILYFFLYSSIIILLISISTVLNWILNERERAQARSFFRSFRSFDKINRPSLAYLASTIYFVLVCYFMQLWTPHCCLSDILHAFMHMFLALKMARFYDFSWCDELLSYVSLIQ